MDNFNLQKFLKESKALENLNPSFKSLNENSSIKEKIKEMILAELGNPEDEDEDTYDYSNDFYDGDPNDDGDPNNFGDTDEYVDFEGFGEAEDIDVKKPITVNTKKIDVGEAKKKDEEVEDVETTDVETTDTTEEVPAEDAPTEESPATGGGLEDVAADMEGTEGDLMDSLMKAFKIAKGMGNEKLETQVGNTLKFFVSEYIGGGEQ
jgi:hypothetical protein